MWRRYGAYCILGLITFILSLFGSFMWLYHYLQSLALLPNPNSVITPPVSPIELAATTATIGGLVLVGAFFREKASPDENEQNKDLKLVGKLILASSACFLVFFFAMEYVRSINTPLNTIQQIYIWATAFAVVIAAYCVSWALGVLVTIVRRL